MSARPGLVSPAPRAASLIPILALIAAIGASSACSPVLRAKPGQPDHAETPAATGGAPSSGDRRELPVTFVRDRDKIEVLVDSKLFTVFSMTGNAKPYLYPVRTPGGKHVTRAYPIATREGEERDHPHHTSLWFAHGDVNGHDFWTARKAERIVRVGEPVINAAGASISATFEWRDSKGNVQCTETRVMTFAADAATRTIDFDITLAAPDAAPLTLGDTKEGTFAMRLVSALCLPPRGNGSIVSSTGMRDAECWGKRAAWVEYSGRIDGEDVGVAIFDHPANHAHPTWWHARDYGLFAANPFGAHEFENRPQGAGALAVEPGKSVRFRYRVLIHEGRWTPDRLREAFSDFSGASPDDSPAAPEAR